VHFVMRMASNSRKGDDNNTSLQPKYDALVKKNETQDKLNKSLESRIDKLLNSINKQLYTRLERMEPWHRICSFSTWTISVQQVRAVKSAGKEHNRSGPGYPGLDFRTPRRRAQRPVRHRVLGQGLYCIRTA